MNLNLTVKEFQILSQQLPNEMKNVEALKKELKDNGFKLCGMGADIMLDSLSDMGMEDEQVKYWKMLALKHLPYSPAEALSNK